MNSKIRNKINETKKKIEINKAEKEDRLIKEGQNKPKTNTNNAKPSGASRGRQLGW